LKRLGLKNFDIGFIHDVEFGDVDKILSETLPEMVKMKKEGLINFIGFFFSFSLIF